MKPENNRLPDEFRKKDFSITIGAEMDTYLGKHKRFLSHYRCSNRPTYDFIMNRYAKRNLDIVTSFKNYQMECNDLLYELGSRISLIEIDTGLNIFQDILPDKLFPFLKGKSLSSGETLLKVNYFEVLPQYIITLDKFINDNKLMDKYKDNQ